MRLLLFSNSTNAGEEYLSYTLPFIKEFTGQQQINALFIPFAGVTISWDDYYLQVKEKLSQVGVHLKSIHNEEDKILAIHQAELIIVGGGNTFNLLKTIQDNNLTEPIIERVKAGLPYIGWSAGSNLSCPSIRTTNDMPIVEPTSFDAFNLVPFQINPHYTDVVNPNHAGETREARIEEFIELNQEIYVAGLREGTMFLVEDGKIELKGSKPCRIFRHGKSPIEISPGEDFSFLIQ
jgi:dipeptidase E